MKRTFSKDFKIKACELVLKDGIKHKVVAEKMGINHIMLFQWIDDYQIYGEDAFVGKGHQHKKDAELKKPKKRKRASESSLSLSMKAFFLNYKIEKPQRCKTTPILSSKIKNYLTKLTWLSYTIVVKMIKGGV